MTARQSGSNAVQEQFKGYLRGRGVLIKQIASELDTNRNRYRNIDGLPPLELIEIGRAIERIEAKQRAA